jgi:hypothetical protein
MANGVNRSDNDKTRKSINATNYKRAVNALEQSKFDKFVPLKSNKEILKLSLKPENIKEVKDVEKMFELITSLFQSMTTQGFTTFEIVRYIANELNKFSDDDRKNIISFLEESYTIVHSNYKGKLTKKNYDNVSRILFNHFKEDEYGAYTDLGYRLIGLKNDINRDIKALCISKKENIIQNIAYAQSSSSGSENKKVNDELRKYYNNINVNKKIENPTKINPSYSCIMINNPDIKVGSRNSLELATFFNSVSNLEFSRAYPFFNAEFVIPNYSKQDMNSVMRAGSINQFINGSLDKSKTTSNYRSMEGIKVEREDEKSEGKIIKTNMALFTTPQTLVNLNEETGHSSNILSSNKSLRLTSIKDSTQPFMTLKNLSINVSPTKGFMSFKTGKLSLVLHDRSRLPDIAPFVKHDLFGAFGAEIVLEYGWSHLDEDNPSLNPLGAFLGNSKVKEVYMITNSSFSMDKSGMVNIDLSISMKGASLLRNTEINFIAENRIKSQSLKSLIARIESCRQSLKITNYETGILSRLKSDNILDPVSQIDKAVAIDLSQFISNYDFLDLENMTSFYKLVGGTDVFTVEINDVNGLLDSKDKYLSLIFGDRLQDANNKKELEINCDYTESEIRDHIDDILNAFKDLKAIAGIILDQDAVEPEIEASLLESIVGGIDFIDPFFPTRKNFYDGLKDPAKYVTFGSILNSLIQTHVLNKTPQDFDEIQTIFYAANEFAAGMKRKNLATFLIPKKELKDFIKKEIKNEARENNNKVGKGIKVLTVESLIAQIINKFIVSRNNPMFGLSELYKLDENQSVIAANEDKEIQKDSVERKLHDIYYPGKHFKAKNDITFKIPSIRMTFDSLNSDSINSRKAKTILRISIYDQNDTPFESISNILQKLYTEDFKKSIDSIARIKNKYGNTGSKTLYDKKIDAEMKILVKKEFVTVKNNKYTFNPLKNIQSGKFKSSIKSFYKELFPSLTFGTQHTAILSANVSTINDNKLASVYITNSDRNNQSELNSRIKPDLPLRVLPTQATIETFGCPWINFGQFIFLDFDTGTTIDNKYAVTGITHNFSPGNFKTSLTLSYGDVYGQYEAAADLIESVTSHLHASSQKLTSSQKNKLLKSTPLTSKDDIVILGEKYIKSKFFEGHLYDVNINHSQRNTIKLNNPLYDAKFHNYLCLLVYHNSFSTNLLENETFKKENYEMSIGTQDDHNNIFVEKFKKFFMDSKEYTIDAVILDDPQAKNNGFKFNIIRDTNPKKNTKLIVSQKINSVNIATIETPFMLFTKKSTKEKGFAIDYNKIAFKNLKSYKESFAAYAREKAEKDNISADKTIKSYDKSLSSYYDVIAVLNKSSEENKGILNLRLQTFTLEDVLGESFLSANEDLWGDWAVDRGALSKELTEAKVVKVSYKVDGNQSERRSAYKAEDIEVKLEKVKSLKKSSETTIHKIEVNVGSIKNIIANNKKAKLGLSSFQNFPIFKHLKVFYDSEIQLTFSNTESKVAAISSQKGIKYYDAKIDDSVRKDIFSKTNIVSLDIIENLTGNAKLQIIILKHKTADGFVEYNKETARFVNIFDPEVDLISIFDKNFIETKVIKHQVGDRRFIEKKLEVVSKGVTKTPIKHKFAQGEDLKGDEPAEQTNRLDREYPSPEVVEATSKSGRREEGLAEDIEAFEYVISIRDLIDYIDTKTVDFVNSKEKILYAHSKEKKLGVQLKKGKNNFKPKNKEGKYRHSFAPENLNKANEHALDWTWDGASGNNGNKSQKQTEVVESVYRGIKESNLPAVDKKVLNLKVMEKYIPPNETSSRSGPGNDEYGGQARSVDYAKITLNFKNSEAGLAVFKEKLDNEFSTAKTHVSFADIQTKFYNASQDYLDYKVKELSIYDATPNKEGIKGTLAIISYNTATISNSSKIRKTRQRRTKIQRRLFYLLYFAAKHILTMKNSQGAELYGAAFDHVYIRTGGDIPLYKTPTRNNSTTLRHDSGYAVDIQLKKDNKALSLTKAKQGTELNADQLRHNEIIWAYLRACKELGATGIGADYDYDHGNAFHIDIAKENPDFKDENMKDTYSRGFTIQVTGGLKSYKKKKNELNEDGSLTISKAAILRSISSIKSVRYWGKDDESGSYKKEAAPKTLKDIYNKKG